MEESGPGMYFFGAIDKRVDVMDNNLCEVGTAVGGLTPLVLGRWTIWKFTKTDIM